MIDIEEFASGEALFDGHYRLLRPLDTSGGTADVWLALDVNTIDNYFSQFEDDTHVIDESSGMLVAIKIYRPQNALDIEGEQRFRDEFKIAFACHHANLLQPTAFSIFKGVPYLVLPYCEQGSVEKYINEKMPNDLVWKFILDVSSGLDRLHTNQPQIVHQDIKPANILIDGNGNFTITDFGISSQNVDKDDDRFDGERSGTSAYMAPERFEAYPKPLLASDIWAFGATLCEILTAQVPFGEEGGQSQKEDSVAQSQLASLPASIRKLITACLQKDPAKRPTARDLMEAAKARCYPASRQRLRLIPWAAAIMALAFMAVYFIKSPKPLKYDEIVEYLMDADKAKKGVSLLDSLARKNDYQAAFLMSRLYFDTSNERDTAFYLPQWSMMRKNSGLAPDNEKAHKHLMDAFRINEKDPVMLYQLGADFLWGRGCTSDANKALWCFMYAADNLDDFKNLDTLRYRDLLHQVEETIIGSVDGVWLDKP